MSCPRCGDDCHCSPADDGGAHTSVLIDPDAYDPSEQRFAATLDTSSPATRASTAPASRPASAPPSAADDRSREQWRDEVSSRLSAFRARRRRRHDPDSTMSLVFEAPPEPHPEPEQVRVPEPPVFVRTQAAETPKIIEFPKPAPQVEELAEPVLDLPRILEAEEEPPAPAAALPPMTLEDEDDNAPGLVAEFDLPLQVASMSQRSFAAMVDWLVVLMASAVFLMIFVKIADALPHSRIALGIGLLVPCFFWGVYHYLFLVHAAATPGMQMAELSLQTFEGEPVKRSLRRWRALALVVSCMSVGLGFVWAVVDEDALCWHDRITRTYAVRQ